MKPSKITLAKRGNDQISSCSGIFGYYRSGIEANRFPLHSDSIQDAKPAIFTLQFGKFTEGAALTINLEGGGGGPYSVLRSSYATSKK
jgi:hypothetical protein